MKRMREYRSLHLPEGVTARTIEVIVRDAYGIAVADFNIRLDHMTVDAAFLYEVTKEMGISHGYLVAFGSEWKAQPDASAT